MDIRLIVDASFTQTINYYDAFPTEPVNNPAGVLKVHLPIEPADRLSGITLQSLLRRIKDVPAAEKDLLISCHGNAEGLAIGLVPGGKELADKFNMHIIVTLASARDRIKAITALPADRQAAAWEALLNGLKYLDGTAMFPAMSGASPSTYQKLFDWFFKMMGGQRNAAFPVADEVQIIKPPPQQGSVKVTFSISFKKESTGQLSPSSDASAIQTALESLSTIGKGNISVTGNKGGPWTCTFINAQGSKVQPLLNVSGGTATQNPRVEAKDFTVKAITNAPSELDELINLRNQMLNRFERLEFRSCNTGKSPPTLAKMKEFFGCKKVTAPDVLSFEMAMSVVIDSGFDKDFDNKVDVATNSLLVSRGRPIAGRQPVKLDQSNPINQVPVPQSDIPKTRRFDSDKVRPGDEVFIRLWVTQVHPHRFFGWLRAISATFVEQFVKDKIDPDIARWKDKSSLPICGLWLVNDFNVLLPTAPPLNAGAAAGYPLNGAGLGAPPPSPLPSFALARDPEYIRHLISSV
jgi:hypothetical protein